MYEFKIKRYGFGFISTSSRPCHRHPQSRCPKAKPHDWTQCPFAHPGEKAKRRDPRRFSYSGSACPEFRKAGVCSRGDACPLAHGVFETWLHPTRYKTQVCCKGTCFSYTLLARACCTDVHGRRGLPPQGLLFRTQPERAAHDWADPCTERRPHGCWCVRVPTIIRHHDHLVVTTNRCAAPPVWSTSPIPGAAAPAQPRAVYATAADPAPRRCRAACCCWRPVPRLFPCRGTGPPAPPPRVRTRRPTPSAGALPTRQHRLHTSAHSRGRHHAAAQVASQTPVA